MLTQWRQSVGAGGTRTRAPGQATLGSAALPRAKVFLCPLEAWDLGVRRLSCGAAHPPPSVPAGAVLVSGVYDLEPILHTYVNDALNMSR